MTGDLRGYLQKLGQIDELRVIDAEVDWNLEAAAVTTMVNRTHERVPLFRNIRGFPSGYGLLGDPYSGTWRTPWRRVALCFGLAPDVSWSVFCDEVVRRMHPIKPVRVSDGPCKEVVMLGGQSNVFAFPWPYIHEGDGACYGTLQSIVSRDPASQWVNWASHRIVIHSRRRLGLPLQFGQHTANFFFSHYQPFSRPMPVAVVVGGDPLINIAAGMPFPAGVNEIEYAGAFRGEPIALVKAETSDLLVPADAELIIEGELIPGEHVDEGPFGEYTGYLHGPRRPVPCLRVTAITHRKDPIIPFTVEGMRDTVSSSTSLVCTAIPLALYVHLRRDRGRPVTSVAMSTVLPWSALVVATAIPYPGYLEQVARYLFHIGIMTYPDFIIFVDEDVDPTDSEQVLEEIMLKAHPLRDIYGLASPRAPKSHLNIYQAPEKRGLELTSKVWIDATTKGWLRERGPRRMSCRDLYPPEIHAQVEAVWAGLSRHAGVTGR